MGALTSIPLCQRARGAEEGGGDTNNNLQGEEDRNITQVVEVQPEATSTPKVLRRIEPLPEDRDLGDSSNSDSLESELEVRAVSERTFGSDSGLEQSGDELEATREVEVHEAEEEEESMEDLNVALPEEEDTEEEEETVESLQTGDLGVDRAKTFRVEKEQPPLDMELDALADEFSEPLPNEEESEEEEEGEREEDEEETSSVSRKLADLGVSEEEEGVSNMLSELTQGSRSHEMARR